MTQTTIQPKPMSTSGNQNSLASLIPPQLIANYEAVERLKKARRFLNMTQAQLANAINRSSSTIARWESGLAKVDGWVVDKVESLTPLSPALPKSWAAKTEEPFFTKILDVNGKTKASFNYDVDINALSYIDVIAENDTIVDGSLNPKATEQDFFVTLQILNYFKNNYLEYLKKLPTQPEQ